MRIRRIKLLHKITILLLAFVVSAFGISAFILLDRVDRTIEKSLKHNIDHTKQQLIKQIVAGESTFSDPDIRIEALAKNKSYLAKADRDTVMLDNDGTELHLYRLHEEVIRVGTKMYLLTIRKNIDDFKSIKSDIVLTLIPIIIILIVVILLFSTLLSKVLFRPFNQIILQMKQFEVGNETTHQLVDTNTAEFCTLQLFYQTMVEKTEQDYKNLKEYTENMAHEIQTPLAIIRSKTENLIANEELMHTQADSVKQIYDEVNNLSKLSNTLKLLTKIENNEFSNRERIVTQPVITSAISLVEELATLKEISFELTLYSAHCLTIDPFLLDIVFKNLLRNSILYAPFNSSICIETAENKFRISNSSTYDKPLSKDVFSRFSHGKTNNSSLGLGLAIVKKICDINGLEIRYQFENESHIFEIWS